MGHHRLHPRLASQPTEPGRGRWGEPVAFAQRYVELLRLRFGDAVRLVVSGEAPPGALLPPMALQVLLENAVKHNEVHAGAPLVVELRLGDAGLVVVNNRRPKRVPPVSAGVGLANLGERVSRLTGRQVVLQSTEDRFAVELPLYRLFEAATIAEIAQFLGR